MPLIKYARIQSMHLKGEDLEYEPIARLASSIKEFIFETEGTRGYKYAQATAGGISLEDIDFKTMASKKAEGLYITGEVLDVDGDCGGYNLQWAWSTGYLAGTHAAEMHLSNRNEE
jgi:predicted flavoprotein YhiN